MAGPTPQHTTGPFFPSQFIRPGDNDLTRSGEGAPRARGQLVVLEGRVTDALGEPVENAILEIWQANADGLYLPVPSDPGFRGWGRTWTDGDGAYRSLTVQPGADAAPPGAARAPTIYVMIIGSGLMRPLFTQVFFPDEPLNQQDPQLIAIADPVARHRLIAEPAEVDDAPPGATALRFDIRLKGEGETPFLTE